RHIALHAAGGEREVFLERVPVREHALEALHLPTRGRTSTTLEVALSGGKVDRDGAGPGVPGDRTLLPELRRGNDGRRREAAVEERRTEERPRALGLRGAGDTGAHVHDASVAVAAGEIGRPEHLRLVEHGNAERVRRVDLLQGREANVETRHRQT